MTHELIELESSSSNFNDEKTFLKKLFSIQYFRAKIKFEFF